MNYPIQTSKIKKSINYFSEVVDLSKEAETYIKSYPWCAKINESFLYTNLGKVLCIFLFEIDNTQSKEDNSVWVIVGDFPPMYLDTYSVRSSKKVIETYIYIVNDWLEHADAKMSMDECFPLDIEISPETIVMLKKRISLLQNSILENIDDIILK